jgi:L-Ala-D/L-Glu epimerase
MELRFQPFSLRLKFPFQTAHGRRTATELVLCSLHLEGFTGHGEASMPPYYGENTESALRFLQKSVPLLAEISDAFFDIEEIMHNIDALEVGNSAAKAAIDIALHDLLGKISRKPVWEVLGADPDKMPPTTFTLGIDTPEVLEKKLEDAADFQILKVKLGTESDDKKIIETLRQFTQKPILVDANQGWKTPEYALDLLFWLAENNVFMIEQPLPKNDFKAAAWLTARSPIPIIADESFQRLADFDAVADCFHGVNIKLMKSAGLNEAWQIAKKAQEKGLKTIMGCMSETSCATLAAAQIAPFCTVADLDGPWLTTNNPYKMPVLKHGKIQLSTADGLGLESAGNSED